MTNRKNRKKKGMPSTEEYNEFLQGLSLDGVYLTQSEVKANTPRPDDDALPLDVQSELEPTALDVSEDGSVFVVFAQVHATFSSDEGQLAEVKATFAATYLTECELSDEFLSLFIKRNLHIHVWPYAREYVQNTLGRFGWQPFALPPLVMSAAREKKE